MAEPATRVALLARPGAACDNLQAALRQLGADVVAVQDPGDGDPAAIAAARPAAVLVALEPAVEDALDRYDTVLGEPGRLVIYDEVAVAARREGWDAARWARHLAAKLGGHADVLPPGAGNDDDGDFAGMRPRASAPTPANAQESRVEEPRAEEPEAASAAFDADSVHLGFEPEQEEALAKAGDGIDFGGFTPEIMASMAMDPMSAPAPREAEAEPGIEVEAPSSPEPRVAFASDGDGDGVDAGSTRSGAAPGAVDDANVLEWEAIAPAPVAAPPAAPRPEPAAPAPARISADEMTLVDMESPAAGSAGGAPFAAGAAASFAPAGGAVVVLAGIGGPDAVRQLLAALPGGFGKPIIVRQRLDGGRHDRLVRQMQRATALPVELAEAGRMLIAGHVYILPDDMTTSGEASATFVPTTAAVPVLAGLPASQSAVLVLSGSDPASVPEVMDAAREGAFVAGQSPEDSFDGAAAAALVAAGGESCTATELAQRISARWQS
ncbi:MAG TPA: chemotaxis protein CheB [Luteimonas sp.]|nr:chemotaxis protein CheB [Luteimonas sp.]